MKDQTKNGKDAKSAKPRTNAVSREMREILKKYNEETARQIDALSKDFQRHTSALSEDFQSKVSMIAEQVIGTNDKIDGVETRLTDKIDGVETRLTDKIDGVIHVQETHTEMIGVVMEDISEIKIELKNKADKTEVARLDRRVLALEHAIR
jgi:hypothetical protein